jgi:short-subunit dehydrogenase
VLAVYARPKGVGVTCLCPRPVATNIVGQVTVHGELGPLSGPPLAVLQPEIVAALVVEAVRDDRFFVPPTMRYRESFSAELRMPKRSFRS